MSYATQADLVISAGGADRFLQLVDFNNDGAIDADVVARALSDADALIDEHLRLRTTQADLDWLRANPTQSVKRIAAEEAIYAIRKWRELAAITETEHKHHEERIALLGQIQVGKLRLADAPSPRQAAWIDADDEDDGSQNGVTRNGLKGMW